MKKLFILFAVLFCQRAYSQVVTDTLKNKNIVIQQDSMIRFLVHQNAAINERTKTMPGYRVQLSSSGNRKSVEDLRNQFVQLHPNIKAYMTYQQPNFRLRVGDFQNRIEANRLLQVLLKQFDSAFIVRDDISVSDQ